MKVTRSFEPKGGRMNLPRWQGDVVIYAFGFRVRFYAGQGFAARPRIHSWRMDEHRGVCIRHHRGFRDQRVFGVQWRWVERV